MSAAILDLWAFPCLLWSTEREEEKEKENHPPLACFAINASPHLQHPRVVRNARMETENSNGEEFSMGRGPMKNERAVAFHS